MGNDLEQEFASIVDKLKNTKLEIQSFIVGQEQVIEQLLWTILSGGHALLEGLPGLGKTMLVRTVSDVMDLSFSRIQFTPDLMPSDVTGTMMIQPDEHGKQVFEFYKGPIFAQIVLADEINRATPKTQSALLEAMAEKTVTILGETMNLPAPFFVLATQNPIDMEGTYPLPEAQLDRFTAKINIDYPTETELKEIIFRTTGVLQTNLTKVMTRDDVLTSQRLAKQIIISEEILDFAVAIAIRTQPTNPDADESVQKYVQYGCGPRGLQSMINLAKARALISGRYHVSIGDIKTVAKPALRHRILLNFEGEAAGITTDHLLDKTIEHVQQGVHK